MTPDDKLRVLDLLQENPILMTEEGWPNQVLKDALKFVVEETSKHKSDEHRLQLFSEVLLDIKQIVDKIKNEPTVMN